MNDEELKRQLRAMVENAAEPVSSDKAMLRASSPARKFRRDWHPTERRLIVVAVAAVIVVVFFVPLPHLSLFNRLVTPTKVRPGSGVTSTTGTSTTTTSTMPSTTVTSTTVIQPVKVPSNGVVGQSVNSARDVLMAAGFKVSVGTRAFSNTVPVNVVITTYPRPGLFAPTGATVFLIVSLGPVAIVPNVVLRTQAAAESVVTAANLTPDIKFVETPGFMPGFVVSQAPFAGAKVPPGTVVTIDVEQSSASTTTTSSP